MLFAKSIQNNLYNVYSDIYNFPQNIFIIACGNWRLHGYANEFLSVKEALAFKLATLANDVVNDEKFVKSINSLQELIKNEQVIIC